MKWLVLGEYSQQTGISVTVGDLATLPWSDIYVVCLFCLFDLPSEPRGGSGHKTFFLIFPAVSLASLPGTSGSKGLFGFFYGTRCSFSWKGWVNLLSCQLGFWCMHRKLVKEERATHPSIPAGKSHGHRSLAGYSARRSQRLGKN